MVGHELLKRYCSQPTCSKTYWLSISSLSTLSSSAPSFLDLGDHNLIVSNEISYAAGQECEPHISTKEANMYDLSKLSGDISFSPLSGQSVFSCEPSFLDKYISFQVTSNSRGHSDNDSNKNIVKQSDSEDPQSTAGSFSSTQIEGVKEPNRLLSTAVPHVEVSKEKCNVELECNEGLLGEIVGDENPSKSRIDKLLRSTAENNENGVESDTIDFTSDSKFLPSHKDICQISPGEISSQNSNVTLFEGDESRCETDKVTVQHWQDFEYSMNTSYCVPKVQNTTQVDPCRRLCQKNQKVFESEEKEKKLCKETSQATIVFESVQENSNENLLVEGTSNEILKEKVSSSPKPFTSSQNTSNEVKNNFVIELISETINGCDTSGEKQKESSEKSSINSSEDSYENNGTNDTKSQRSPCSLHAINVNVCTENTNSEIVEMQSVQNVNKENHDPTKVDNSDEDISSAQLFHKTTHKMSSPQKGNSHFITSSLSACGDKDELSFSPLYSQICYEDESRKALITKSPCSPFLPRIKTFSPLRSLDAAFACKIPMQNIAGDCKLSPNCMINNSACKSDSHHTKDIELVECKSDKQECNEILDEVHENLNEDDGKTNEDPQQNCYIEKSYPSPYSEQVQSNHNCSGSSDETPDLAVFSPLSVCKMDCEIEIIDNENHDKLDMPSYVDVMTNQRVPESEEKVEGGSCKNVNKVNKDQNDFVIDIKIHENKTCQCSEKQEFPEMGDSMFVSNNENSDIDHCRREMKCKLLKDYETDHDDEKVMKEVNKGFCLKANKNDHRPKENIDDISTEQQTVFDNKGEDCFENETDDNLNEQVVPGISLMTDNERSLEESSLYESKNVIHKERKPNLLEQYPSSFHWKSVYGSVFLENSTSIPSTGESLGNIKPLPSFLKRTRPLRIGLSKRQKVKHLHEK